MSESGTHANTAGSANAPAASNAAGTPPDGGDIEAILRQLKTANYGDPTIVDSCDLLMKGGVTSGVVYPTTICRLAQTFRLRNIGGTSAGALASALAAAAEYERVAAERAGRAPVGFQRLAAVPEFLGTGKNLENLFQPSKTTAPLFHIFLKLIDANASWWSKLWTPFAEHPISTTAAVVVALLFYAFNVGWIGPWSGVYGAANVLAIVAAVVVFVLVAVATIGANLARIVLGKIPDNEYGMCTGLDRENARSPLPLTPWLADRIDFVAGRSDSEVLPDEATLAPLTFGDLYDVGISGPPPPYPYPSQTGSAVLDDLNERSTRVVNLEMVTTDVTAGRPYRLPFNPRGITKFYFDPDDFRKLFPKRVVDHMLRADDGTPAVPLVSKITTLVDATPRPGRTTRSRSRAVKTSEKTLYPFPNAQRLPVVVAARMSMSFPVLFSAVPLYAVNRAAQEENRCPPDALEVRKTWFSDGGLSSNIPIHFFDGPIPRWPTFALNLRGFPRTSGGCDDPLDTETATNPQKVFLATRYDPDVELFRDTGNGRLFQFINSIIDAMQNWNDNTLMQLPGYRERTVEIAMLDSEGGLNLVMPQDTIDSIMERGYYAADLFKSKFATPRLNDSDHWNDHRHIRLRSSLLMQSEWTRRFQMAWDSTSLSPPYPQVVSGIKPPYEEPYDPSEVPSAQAFAKHLRDAPDTIGPGVTLTKQPNPSPELRARPRV
jgi:predicted acylesterase/phospholipase RssA